MFTKRRIRFSIGAMLVLMAGVAVSINHEVQRAKAIEATVNKIKDWQGLVSYRPRSNMPEFLSYLLPKPFVSEIDTLMVALYTNENPQPGNDVMPLEYGLISPHELEDVLNLGALDKLRKSLLLGTAFKLDTVRRITKSPNTEECGLSDTLVSNDEYEMLKASRPECLWICYPRQ